MVIKSESDNGVIQIKLRKKKGTREGCLIKLKILTKKTQEPRIRLCSHKMCHTADLYLHPHRKDTRCQLTERS